MSVVINEDTRDQNTLIPQEGDIKQEPIKTDLIAGKFKNVEDLAKAYKELEKRFHTEKQNKPVKEGSATTDAPDDVGDTNKTEDQEAKDSSENRLVVAGIDVTDFAQEYQEKGRLSEESYKALEEKGIPRHLVDSYIEGVKNTQSSEIEQIKQAIYQTVEGEENYREFLNWASQNLSEDEIDAYNSALDLGKPALIQTILKDYYNRFKANRSNPPKKRVQGQPVSSDAGDIYESFEQVTRDMARPEYREDPAFRSYVQNKMARSIKAGRI